MVEHELDRSGPGQAQVAGLCGCGYEPLGAIKFRKIID
jgi:hypothetical protein